MGLAACLQCAPADAADDVCRAPEPKTGNGWADVANPRECELLAAYPGVVTRDDLSLIVKLKNRTTVYYYDNPYAHILECGNHGDTADECLIFRVWEISPNRRYVTLKLGYYEGGSAMLIDRQTGDELPLSSAPFLSPSGRYWAAVDDDNAYGTGEIAVVGRKFGKLSVIAAMVKDNCNFERWDTDTSFLVICYDFDLDTDTELRVTWDKSGALTMTPTRRAISGEL
jgi:hypothetical protein